MSGILQDLSFCDWLILLSIKFSRIIEIVTRSEILKEKSYHIHNGLIVTCSKSLEQGFRNPVSHNFLPGQSNHLNNELSHL